MKKNDVVTLAEINKWKNAKYKKEFDFEKYRNGGNKWWNKRKKEILNNTKFKVVSLG